MVLLLLALLSGCAQPPRAPQQGAPLPEGDPLAFAAPVAVPCKQLCFEPSVAVDGQDRVWVAPGLADGGLLMVSTDKGRTFNAVVGPPPIAALLPVRDDYLIQAAPDGSVWFTALVGKPGVGIPTDGGPDYRGLQVARSADGGRTWSPNVVYQPGGKVDRQFLAFDAAHVYLMFQTFGEGVKAARSDDGGTTFQPIAPLSTGRIIGAPCVLSTGRVVWPVFDHGLRMAISDDLGGRWNLTPTLGEGAYFPALGCAQTLRVAWWSPTAIHLAESTDQGAHWHDVAGWNGTTTKPSASPALHQARTTELAYFGLQADGTASLLTARISDAVVHRGIAATGIKPVFKDGRANSDFASLALLHDGRMVVVWAANGDTLMSAVET